MTLEALTKRIKTTTDLKDIVGTMKMLSSVSIAPYEKALKSINRYGQTVKDAFVGLLKKENFTYMPRPIKSTTPQTIAIVVGTDNGLVGRFNRDILSFAKSDLTGKGCFEQTAFICVGKRLGLMADSAKLPLVATYAIMNSLKEIASIASMVLMKVNEVIPARKTEQVLIYFMKRKSGEPQKPAVLQLMPLPFKEMMGFKAEKWTGKTPPLITANYQELFTALIHEYLTVVLSGALTASLAAEHYTRMVNMQQAEKNIDDSLTDMNLTYQQLRQAGITDELIDIVSGAESLKKKR